MKIFRSTSKRSQAGFSLVEVTLALGITAVALVSLMGMIPRGMKTMQRASDLAVMGRIHQQILGEIQLTSWEAANADGASPLDDFDGAVRYYDDQGIELLESEKGGFGHVYTARINLPKPGSALPNSVGNGSYRGAAVPGETAMSDRFIRLVVVEITSNADPQFLENPEAGFDGLDYPNAVATYRTMVAKMGQEYEASASP